MGEPLLVYHEKPLVIAAFGFTVGFAVTATAEFVQRAMSVTRVATAQAAIEKAEAEHDTLASTVRRTVAGGGRAKLEMALRQAGATD